jgi:ankyrin repeat protein
MKPLHFACLCKHKDQETRLAVIQWLLGRSASPDPRNSDGDTPMNYLALCNDVPAATLLLQHGADINLKGVKKYTPLHQATHYGALEMVLFLLQNGASTIQRNDKGDTPHD